MSRAARIAVAGLSFAMLAGAVVWIAIRPSHDRPWVAEQERLPTATVEGGRVVVHDIRNFDWTGAGPPEPRWEERVYDLAGVESVWFVLTPFARDWRGPAHAFLSFGFADSQYLAISVEARKEVGESYTILKGLLKRFEIMYVVADERDLIGVRALRYDDDVFVYPVRATAAAARALLLEMLDETNRLAAQPEFYGSLRNNCTTRILRHVNRIAATRIGYGWRVLLPGYSDGLALELGLIDTDLSLEAARARFRVNDRVREHAASADFSVRIRRERSRAGTRTPIDTVRHDGSR